jgi:hypothetical protein
MSRLSPPWTSKPHVKNACVSSSVLIGDGSGSGEGGGSCAISELAVLADSPSPWQDSESSTALVKRESEALNDAVGEKTPLLVLPRRLLLLGAAEDVRT